MERMQEKNLFKTNRNKYNQSEANHNTKNYENNLKVVTELQGDVKGICKEREGEWNRLSA